MSHTLCPWTTHPRGPEAAAAALAHSLQNGTLSPPSQVTTPRDRSNNSACKQTESNNSLHSTRVWSNNNSTRSSQSSRLQRARKVWKARLRKAGMMCSKQQQREGGGEVVGKVRNLNPAMDNHKSSYGICAGTATVHQQKKKKGESYRRRETLPGRCPTRKTPFLGP